MNKITDIVGLAGLLLGLVLGWALWHPRAVPIEAAAPAVRQHDNSLILARRPDTVVKIQQVIPKGWVPERQVETAVQPQPIVLHDTIITPTGTVVKVDTVNVPAVRIALTLARLPDGTHRVLASSPDGRVLDSLSVDIPRGEAAAPARVLRWSVGPTYQPPIGGQPALYGGVITRDLWSFRIVAGVDQRAGRIGVALRF